MSTIRTGTTKNTDPHHTRRMPYQLHNQLHNQLHDRLQDRLLGSTAPAG
ncbi:hypothetical protein [Arthrobacter sp. AL12]|nr:hypothetical protein [Arthrobacter sp. AL12]MDI3212470.1 hypothetical protein [Arthrobacter sp. AL12]